MSYLDIIPARKDEAYRLSLSDVERAQLLGNSAGLIELTDAALGAVIGGMTIQASTAIGVEEAAASEIDETKIRIRLKAYDY